MYQCRSIIHETFVWLLLNTSGRRVLVHDAVDDLGESSTLVSNGLLARSGVRLCSQSLLGRFQSVPLIPELCIGKRLAVLCLSDANAI
mmetsp:Transcript_15493/g.28439  ORF Transcript_15493/g.28439 Transcript_15493/m.28439 type:complete len:88 (+) Transcript_15493:28-291(+)